MNTDALRVGGLDKPVTQRLHLTAWETHSISYYRVRKLCNVADKLSLFFSCQVENNPRTGNFGALVRVFLGRTKELKISTECQEWVWGLSWERINKLRWARSTCAWYRQVVVWSLAVGESLIYCNVWLLKSLYFLCDVWTSTHLLHIYILDHILSP